MPNFNTIAMGFLFTLFVALGLTFMSEVAFYVKKPEVAGYEIEIDTGEAAAEAEAPVEVPIATRLATADVDAGSKVARKCAACHTFEEGGANKVGPALWNIVNRQIAAVDGFGYSGALTDYAADKVWTYEELYGFLKAPKDWVKGTSMSFAGLRKPDERANIIAYMRSLSPDPAPLPTQ